MKTVVGMIEYGRETIRYEVRFLPTRRTLGIEVHPDQRVVIRAPVGCTEDVIADRVRKRASWISRQIADFRRYSPRTPQRQYVSGETHLYLGRQYRLKVGAGETASVRMTRGQLCVTMPGIPDPERVKTMLHRWYLDHARRVFSEVLDQCLIRFKGHPRPRLIVRAMQSRWGSLSQTGSMTLNVNLVRAPRACIEYVVTHELCHLRHRDHDASFFKLLGRVMPDWEQRKQKLETALL
ncbi:MAG: SprT family zinc-dependent metalloprotease [Rhodocyclaceae bacterium]|uniref:M48 family metallopeptidase n=1 Tax=Sulfuricystis thermophila TaxID=2496847 RepID=UPI0010365555|nr:SprT family zinc-dependent metalloprotease [Sulfuricystis thermophila]MDI6750298.1 SprT family zinc-dependent metalloprotease [Rhodocyclaceae bacterium]